MKSKTKDYPGRLRISVTARDIQRGAPLDDRRCPVALALRRQLRFPGARATYDSVDHDENNPPFAIYRDSRGSWALPRAVAKFMQRFDDCLPVKPFSFLLARRPTAKTWPGFED